MLSPLAAPFVALVVVLAPQEETELERALGEPSWKSYRQVWEDVRFALDERRNDELETLIREGDQQIAFWASAMLARAPEERGRELVRTLLRSDDPAAIARGLRAVVVFRGAESDGIALASPLQAHEDADVRYWATFALGRLGVAAEKTLVASLAHADPDVRACAAEALSRLTWPVREQHRHEEEASWMIRVRENEQRRARWADALVRGLSDEDERVRYSCSVALYRLMPDSASLAALERACSDPSPGVRYWAEHAVERASEPQEWRNLALLCLEETVESKASWRDSVEPIATGFDFGLPERPHDGGWEFVNRPFKDLRDHALVAIELARAVVPSMLADAESDSAETRAEARDALERLEAHLSERLRKLLLIYEDANSPRSNVVVCLKDLGSAGGAAARSALLNTHPGGMPSYEWPTRLAVDMEVLCPELVLCLEQWQVFARRHAAIALAAMGEPCAPVVRSIVSDWRSGGFGDWLWGPQARFEQEFESLVPGSGFWWEGDDDDRSYLHSSADLVEELFAQLTTDEVAPILTEALSDRHAVVRERARRALAALQHK